MISTHKKTKIIKNTQTHEKDTGSPDVQIGILTKRIEELSLHLKKNKKDNHSRRGLLGLVSDRRRHLKYLEKENPARYKAVVKKLKLKK